MTKSTSPPVKSAAAPKPAATQTIPKPPPSAKTRIEKAPRSVKLPKPEPVEREPARPIEDAKPAKPLVDADLVHSLREMLVRQRQQLLSVVQSTQAQMADKSGDLPDVSARASEGFEDELAVGLMAVEAAQLDDIEAAIRRIDEGTYGICLDCHKAIPRKRLEVLPFACRCLACEGQKERRSRSVAEYEEEEDND